jgi:hypothetical protein
MKWRCALIQQRLPDYPDGDLSPFWKRRVASHLEVCPDCRQEAEELAEVMSVYKAHPLPEPGPDFWQGFQQELHLKLAQVNQAPETAPRRLRIPHYLLGATAMAGILALAIYLGPFSQPSSTLQMAKPQGDVKAPEMALGQEAKRAKTATAAAPAPPPPATRQPVVAAAPAVKMEAAGARLAKPAGAPAEEAEFSLAAGKAEAPRKMAQNEEGILSEDDDLDWDLDSVVADLSKEERQHLKSRLESRR